MIYYGFVFFFFFFFFFQAEDGIRDLVRSRGLGDVYKRQVLYGVDIPPVGGDTHFSNQQISFESLPDEAKIRLQGMKSIHSSAATYSAQGLSLIHI